MDTDNNMLQVNVKRSINYKQLLADDHHQKEEDDVRLPGFRFHPTDEELVGFYLRRKVDKKLLKINLIKQIDIYKYDPWDLPQNSDAGENEWYYFCKRGRKYRNSVRPNRVTGSGFWKATGIDRPIFSSEGSAVCIGLKKSLVYYRGSAGKGTKTEWMMHEFRLPQSSDTDINCTKNIKNKDDKSLSQEAEVWTLCRILKRSVCHKSLPDWKEVSTKRNHVVDTSSKTCSVEYDHNMQSYISFEAPIIQLNHVNNQFYNHQQLKHQNHLTIGMNHLNTTGCFTQNLVASDQAPSATASSSSFSDPDMNDFIKHRDWDDLRSVVEFAASDGRVFFM